VEQLKEELVLFLRLKQGDQSAREKIFKMHQPMVVSVARRYQNKSKLSIEELIAEGYVGLLQAIEKFNLVKARRRRVKFSSYAYWWVRRYILRAIIKEQSILSVPESVSELVHQYNHFSELLSQELGREPTEGEVGKILTLSQRQMKRVSRRRALKEVPIDSQIYSGQKGYYNLAEVITAQTEENIEKNLERETLLERFFKVLSPLEKEVVSYRFGLKNRPQLTYQEIAERIREEGGKNLSRQRVHQIFHAALKRIQSIMKGKENEPRET